MKKILIILLFASIFTSLIAVSARAVGPPGTNPIIENSGIKYSVPEVGGLVHCGRSIEKDDPRYVGLNNSEFEELVTRYSKKCEICDVLLLADRLKNVFFFYFVPTIAGLLFIYGGFMIFFGGTFGTIETGKIIFKNTTIGVVIIFIAWISVTGILKFLVGDKDISNSWYVIDCDGGISESISQPIATPITRTNDEYCANTQENWEILAKQNNAKFPAGNPKATDDLIDCIKAALPGKDLGEISTFDKSYNICNFTRARSCRPCSHSTNSCHYGGSSGTEGALAIDFGGRLGGGGEPDGQAIVDSALACGAKAAKCDGKGIFYPNCLDTNVDHVHVTVKGCDKI